MAVELTKGQLIAIKLIEKWYKSGMKQVFELAGAGGTGKSTVVRYIIDELQFSLDEVAFVTFTGKASLVLTMKGTPATTIHKLIYQPVEESLPVIGKDGKPVIENGVVKLRRVTKFEKVEKLDPKIKLIVADECGMINDELWNDLLSFKLPIIVLGDLYQLPPIQGESPLLKDPDYELWEIMRQAKGNPIIHLATNAREGKKIELGRYGKYCAVIRRDQITDRMLMNTDINLACTNKVRASLNKNARRLFGRTGHMPVQGDKLICRKNNWSMNCASYPLINGMIGYVENNIDMDTFKPYENSFLMDFRPEFLNDPNDYFAYLKSDCRPFNSIGMDVKTITKERFNDNNIFEYGYAITVHLSQGSSWGKVLFNADLFGDATMRRQLLYTGITRAEERLILAT